MRGNAKALNSTIENNNPMNTKVSTTITTIAITVSHCYKWFVDGRSDQ